MLYAIQLANNEPAYIEKTTRGAAINALRKIMKRDASAHFRNGIRYTKMGFVYECKKNKNYDQARLIATLQESKTRLGFTASNHDGDWCRIYDR